MKQSGAVVIGVAAALVCGAVWGAAEKPSGAATAPSGAAATYSKTCAPCHGKDGKGSEKMAKMMKAAPAALDLTNTVTGGRTDDDLAKTIADGKGKMPKYGSKMKPAEISGLVGYVRSLGAVSAMIVSSTLMATAAPASSTTSTATVVAAPATGPAPSLVYAKHCGMCHGVDGRGNGKMAMIIKCDPAALDLEDDATLAQTDEALIKVTTDGKGKMPGFGKKLPAGDIKAIVAWMRSAKPAK